MTFVIWLPRPSFSASAEALLDYDLSALRLDIVKLLETLHETEAHESDLPEYVMSAVDEDDLDRAVASWTGYEMQLAEYGLRLAEEYGMRTRRRDPLYDVFSRHMEYALSDECAMGTPPWFGSSDVHLSHQAALVKRNGAYAKFLNADPDLELVWPVSDLG